MISYSEALAKVREVAAERSEVFAKTFDAISVEPNSAANLIGRISVETVMSNEFIPPFHNSSMDGFALVAESTFGASLDHCVRLPVKGIVYAGKMIDPTLKIGPNTATEIMTGAALPPGYDAVVKIEDVRVLRDPDGRVEWIELSSPLEASENIRECGTDFQPRQILLKSGSRVFAEHILAFATVGVATVKVLRKPRIAVISTGDELVDQISEKLSGGMIRNSTAPYLMSALPSFGVEGKYYGSVKDDPDAFKAKFQEILRDAPDVILTTGAVSKGKLDFVPNALLEMNAEMQFHGVAMRPGKPLFFAKMKAGPAVFGAPGNPISTAVALRFYVYPYLLRLQSLADEEPELAELQHVTLKSEGLRCFWKGYLTHDLHGTRVESLEGQESYRVSSLLPANAWIAFPESGERVPEKTRVHTYPLIPKWVAAEDASRGGCC